MIVLTPTRVVAIFVFAELFLAGCAPNLPEAPRYAAPPPPPPPPAAEPFVEHRPQDRIGKPIEYEHSPDREYTVYAGRGGLTPIVLLPGTRSEGVSLADPSGWRIDDRQRYGSGRSSTPVVVVSPDVGSLKMVRAYAKRLGADLALVDKRRPQQNEVEVMNIIGEVQGKNVLLLDDLIDTAGTLTGAANAIAEAGATEVIAAATHPIFSGPAYDR